MSKKLILSQAPDPRVPAIQPSTKVLDRVGASIGRGAENDWVLPDPDRDLSKQHCVVSYRDGLYSLTDVSTNGVFLNGAADRMLRGSAVVLEEGDSLRIGPYVIEVRMMPVGAEAGAGGGFAPAGRASAGAGPAVAAAFPPGAFPPGPFPPGAVPVQALPDPFGGVDPFGGLPAAGDAAGGFGVPSGLAAGPTPRQPGFGAAPGSGNGPPIFEDDDLADLMRPQAALPGGSSPFGAPPIRPAAFGGGFGGFGPGSPQPGAELPGDDFGIFADRAPVPSWGPTSEADHVPATAEYFRPPAAIPSGGSGMSIPDDWDIMGDDEPPAPPRPAPPPPVARPVPTPSPAVLPVVPGPDALETGDPFGEPQGAVIRPRQPVPQPALQAAPAPDETFAPRTPAPRPAPPTATAPRPRPAGGDDLLAAFLAGAGLQDLDLSGQDAAELMQRVGLAYRQMVAGLREILMARSMVKNEFRLNQTVIGAANNNPLKFSLDVDAAVTALLRPPGAGYLPADRAVEEGFQDIRAHSLAMMAGMQVALQALLARFDPKTLEQQLDRHSVLSSIMPGARKARYWEIFYETYNKIAREAEDDFQGIFGREFARAYEEQVKKL